MKRELEFRGIHINKRELVYGIPTYDMNYLFNASQSDSPDNYQVIPESICQYVGLKDSCGLKIYETDTVAYTLKNDSSQKEIKGVVEWHNHAWRIDKIWLLTEIATIKIFKTPKDSDYDGKGYKYYYDDLTNKFNK